MTYYNNIESTLHTTNVINWILETRATYKEKQLSK